jgi:hypothetical protein
MKYPIYMSLSYNSPDFQYKADFGNARDMLLVSVLVSEVELKLSNNS